MTTSGGIKEGAQEGVHLGELRSRLPTPQPCSASPSVLVVLGYRLLQVVLGLILLLKLQTLHLLPLYPLPLHRRRDSYRLGVQRTATASVRVVTTIHGCPVASAGDHAITVRARFSALPSPNGARHRTRAGAGAGAGAVEIKETTVGCPGPDTVIDIVGVGERQRVIIVGVVQDGPAHADEGRGRGRG